MKYLYILTGTTSTGYGKDILQIIYILIICIVVFLGAYYSSRLLGNYHFKKNKTSNIKIIEAISVGPQKTIQLLKIGSEFVLIGVTKDKITLLKDISQENIDLSLIENCNETIIPFSQYMDKIIKKKVSKRK